MAYQFATKWNEDVKNVSTLSEFQTATVVITDPNLVETEYDIETDETTVTGDGKIYEGRARVIGLSDGSFDENGVQANPTSIVGVRVQLAPEYNGVSTAGIRFGRGTTLEVTAAPDNPVLADYSYKASSDFQGSAAGARNLIFYVDLDSSNGS